MDCLSSGYAPGKEAKGHVAENNELWSKKVWVPILKLSLICSVIWDKYLSFLNLRVIIIIIISKVRMMSASLYHIKMSRIEFCTQKPHINTF